MSQTATQPPAFSDGGRAGHTSGTAFLGMIIFMASWAMLFASLFFAYGMVRAGATVWPPADLPRPPRALPGLATLVLAVASLALHRAVAAMNRSLNPPAPTAPALDPIGRVPRFLALAFIAGTGFLTLQLAVWRNLWLAGLRPNGGPYASAFYTLTVFHGLHVIVGILGLLWVAARMTAGAPRKVAVPLRLWALYWHMVGVVWVIMFGLVYLV